MERLTRRTNGVVVYVGAHSKEAGGQIPCEVGPQGVREILARLAEYEDAGHSPAACEQTRKIEEGLNAYGYSIARMVELMIADKEGRVAVLPCKVGGEVYSTLDDLGRLHRCRVPYVSIGEKQHLNWAALDPVDYKGPQYGAPFRAFGKTVFLTREEAEEALRRAEK